MIIVDASVAVKWFFAEPQEELARGLLEGEDRLGAPAIIRIEVATAMTKKARRGEIERGDAEAALELWSDTVAKGALLLLPDGDLLARAAALSIDMEHPLQDCLYLAAAEHVDARLITADAGFARRVGAASRVMMLSALRI